MDKMNIQIIKEEIDGLKLIFQLEKKIETEKNTVLKISPSGSIETIDVTIIGDQYVKTQSPIIAGSILIIFSEEKKIKGDLILDTNSKILDYMKSQDQRIAILEKSIKNRVTTLELSRIPAERFNYPVIG
jgi:hypothetical protein